MLREALASRAARGLVCDIETLRGGALPIPADLAEPLWRAHELVARTLEEPSRRYNLAEDGWTIYAAEAKRPRT